MFYTQVLTRDSKVINIDPEMVYKSQYTNQKLCKITMSLVLTATNYPCFVFFISSSSSSSQLLLYDLLC